MLKKTNYSEDTIVAISTPIGIGGLGIVRLSGSQAIDIAEKIFFPKNKTKTVKTISSFTVTLGEIVDGKTVIDEVLMTLMRGPQSYTCEDVVEFSCHGGIVVLKSIVELCLKHGARLAEPGEFTKRAFLNGRIDLSQAESVAQLINAKTTLQSQIATKSLLGITKKGVEKIVAELKQIIAEVEVTIDYPEDEKFIYGKNIKNTTNKILKQINEVLTNSEKLTPLLAERNIAIVGKPNVGKSSLLNILLHHDRAIVSNIPGTTRDTISETINLNNISIRIVDTAGIRTHSQDVIEKVGMQKTKEAIEEAEVILFVIDASKKLEKEDFCVAEIINETSKVELKKVIILINKIDLNPKFDLKNVKVIRSKINNCAKVVGAVKISCKTEEGIKKLEEIITNLYIDKRMKSCLRNQEPGQGFVLTNLRQLELVKNAKGEIENAIKIELAKSPELFCHHLSLATKELLKITGGEFVEDVLDIIFSKFCVGK
ncbi:MAG: tRNA uridine-5-carboxymethylaminomethyl(34) synthesis GTPase MnmE [Endomicrobiia bacterium]